MQTGGRLRGKIYQLLFVLYGHIYTIPHRN
jgi:hypothetical protein